MQSHSARRIQSLLDGLGGSTYLEIGVEHGVTLFDVKAQTRHGVDPNFRFEPANHEEPGMDFYPTTSDSFFAAIDSDIYYDVIFLDGLHEFEQTYRDFCNALSHCHSKSVILIDDVFPIDVFGAQRQHSDAIRFRQMHGLSGQGWYGDVYKVVFAIHDFHTTLNYQTIVGKGNAQTVVWKGKRESRRPALVSLEAISRLSWFDMRKREEVMHLATEEDAISDVLKDLVFDSVQGGLTVARQARLS